jgi:hypothetical protein
MDKGFHRVVPGGHGLQQGGQPGERTFAIHEIPGGDHAGLDQFEGAAHRAGSVVKTREQSQVGIVDQSGIESHRGPRRATAEKIHRAALAHKAHRRFPDLRFADSLENDIETGAARLL